MGHYIPITWLTFGLDYLVIDRELELGRRGRVALQQHQGEQAGSGPATMPAIGCADRCAARSAGR